MNLSAVFPLFSDNGALIFHAPIGDAYELTSVDFSLRVESVPTDLIYSFSRAMSSA